MVAAVPAQITKILPRPPAAPLRPCPQPAPTSASLCLCGNPNLSPLCFHTLTNPFSRNSLIFTSIQNPRGVTPLRPLCSDLSALCVAVFPGTRHFPFIFFNLPPLFLSLLSFAGALPLFSVACSLFCQNTRGGGGSTQFRTTHYSLSLLIQQLASWKQVQECRCG